MKEIIVESLNIGLPKKEIFYGKEITTGICKSPVSRPLKLEKTGFEGNGVADLKHHGGEDKAVCVYSLDYYPYWEDILGIKLPPAAFGENLSVSNLHEDDVCIGDIFQLGTAVVQVSQPRQPCRTLAARYGRNDMVKLVAASDRTGFYFRVLEEGVVRKGDRLVLQERDPRKISVSFAGHTFHHDKRNCESIKKVLDVPALSESWQQSFRKLKEECL
ncbi:MAG TPA: MOSC domain-containing protein [Nitrospirae bacterium]|nr:6-N-hydroxylaminopurine resistance protein [bacterium BMS3Abin06]HDH11174.1 MOSC domain-containing protein [Nitrospirota bacterium]HDZ00111.1 MOSC domain-containing protein [Nitrospirota bacterium]